MHVFFSLLCRCPAPVAQPGLQQTIDLHQSAAGELETSALDYITSIPSQKKTTSYCLPLPTEQAHILPKHLATHGKPNASPPQAPKSQVQYLWQDGHRHLPGIAKYQTLTRNTL